MERAATHVSVQSEEAIVWAVRAARERGGRLRAVGSGGSKSGITDTAGTALCIGAYASPVVVRDGAVTVEAGITCGQLNALLHREGFVVPTVGEWEGATVGGALATGTHGGSARNGIFSTSLRGVRLVCGTGEVVQLSRGDADFVHAGVSLGALGVVSTVTLECVQRFRLKLETDVVPIRDYLRDPLLQEASSEFHSSVWVPSAGRVITFAADRTTAGAQVARRAQRFGPRTALASYLSRVFGLHDAVSTRWFRRTDIGDCAAILVPITIAPRFVRLFWGATPGIRAAELAVGRSQAAEALALLDKLFTAHPRALVNPVGLRLSTGDAFTVSPCCGRDTYWVDLFYRATEPFVAALAALAERLEVRCHWGKHIPLQAQYVRRQYPGWGAFAAARARFDPDEVFANHLTDALGLTGGAQSKPAA